MSEGLILIFVLYIIYLIMKKTKTTTEKPVPKAKAAQPITTVAAKAISIKPSPDRKPAKKTQAVAPQPAAAISEIAMPERVGLTAGNIWHYLAEKGATPVAKLVRELPEEEKIIQRSIGWLAQEGKIILGTVDRVETIALKG
jgi:predicted DNA-binding transcriptional regulator AlpA